MTHIFKNNIALSVITLLIGLQLTYATGIEGPSPIGENSTHTYTFDDGLIHFAPNWQVTGAGTISSSGISGTEYYVVVQWGTAGSGTIELSAWGSPSLGSLTVTVSTGLTIPNSPTIINHPSYTVLTKAGIPPVDVEWCWQNSPTGEDISATAIAQSVTMMAGTRYYLRAVDIYTGEWSDALTINYTVDIGPPVATNISNENYVYTIVPQIPTTDVTTLQNDEKIETVTYYDGLGRPLQGTKLRAGSQHQDIVTHIDYDVYGRQAKDYLPFAISSSGGVYNSGALGITNSFYNTEKYENTLNPYSEKAFEPSPLNRVLQQAAPGADWALGNGHEIEFEYDTNTATEVKRFSVALSFANNIYTPTLTGGTTYYSVGELYKTVTRDENHDGSATKEHTTEEFKDKQGRVVLKRTYNMYPYHATETAHDTYYVYDDYGNLTYVLSPKMDASNTDLTTLISWMDELGYQYVYDHRNRLVEKKVPGKGWEYIVYDNLDRPVLTQDANQRALAMPQWLFTKYDVLGRVAYTGTFDSNSSRSALQTTFNNKTAVQNYETKATSGTGYDNSYYTNNNFPTSPIEILTVNYYDNYNFDMATLSIPASYEGQAIVNHDNASPKDTKGLATGSRVRVLDPNQVKWITSITAYDEKGRPIYTASNNDYLGTIDIVESKLAFTGNVDKTETTHTKGGTTIGTEDLYTYDHMGRLTQQTQSINNAPVPEVIVENTYDELGQLVTKKVGNEATASNRLQTTNYTYNIRGWLTKINDPNGIVAAFSLGLNYNNPKHGATPLYNGNISETEWRSINPADNSMKWYTYGYDGLNRITHAIDNTSDKRYSLGVLGPVRYDYNGNVTLLNRNGAIVDNPDPANSSDFGFMDYISYSYEPYSNKLKSANEIFYGNHDFGFKDNSTATQQYDYDANGNMLSDANKGITNIVYNHLNLPTLVTINDGGSNIGNINYIYDATGIKQRKIVNTGTTISYAGNYVYQDTGSGDVLQFFNHSEGYVEYINFAGGIFNYVYQYKDHLGNVRMSFKDSNNNGYTAWDEILEENHYYPFGLKHKGYNTNVNSSNIALKRKFGGKEYQDELGLGWYDITARNYDPALGRWMNVDPLAEMMRRHSPYNYAFNNPMRFTDPDGMSPDDVIIKGEQKEEAFKQLQSSTSLELDMDDDGNVTVVGGEAKTDDDKQLQNAITDHSVIVNVDASNSLLTSKETVLIGGSLMGNKITDKTVEQGGKTLKVVETSQEVNVNNTSRIDDFYKKPGATILHEVTESFIAGKNSQRSGKAYGFTKAEYDAAHGSATKEAGPIFYRLMDKNGKMTTDESNYQYIDVYLKSGNREDIIRQLTRK